MLKKITLCILVVLVALIALVLLLPKETQVSRSIVIDRSIERVFAKLNSFREIKSWSPWLAKDPDTKLVFEGPISGVSANMSWQSEHKDVKSGHQVITESRAPSYVATRLNFDGQGSAIAEFKLLELSENSTQLTWSFSSDEEEGFLTPLLTFAMDTFVGSDFEQGLQNLKQLLENEADDAMPSNIIQVDTDTIKEMNK